MKQVWLIARTEYLRNLSSPISVSFIGAFLLATYLLFFNQGSFFARNIADLWPLFNSMPLLLVLVVSALSMRGWAEEQQRRQSEHLFSLPVPIHHWVMGRFYGGLGLIVTALIGTLPLVVTAWWCGPLDWGPVICGYLGACLLGAAYLALGLALSAMTAHQMVALIGTALMGGSLYLLGTESVLRLVNASTAEWLTAISTSGRFASLAKGVVDLWDIGYFCALTSFCLLLNVLVIRLRPYDLDAPSGRRVVTRFGTIALLGVLNCILYIAWTQNMASVQLDLTEEGLHSLDPVTTSAIGQIQDPISIRGLFSDVNHEKLAPFIPRIRDTLDAFARTGRDTLHIRFEDPATDLAVQQEVAEVYGIVSRPLRVMDARRKTIVNAYFNILIEQGSNHVVLNMEDLLVTNPTPLGQEFRLGNIEYVLTRALLRLNKDALPIEQAVARLPTPIKMTLWQTSPLIPKSLAETQRLLLKVAEEYSEAFPEQFVFSTQEFDGSPQTAQQLHQDFQLAPVALESQPDQPFYLHLLVEVTPEIKLVIPPSTGLDGGELRSKIEDSIRSSHPAFTKHVQLVTKQSTLVTPNAASSSPNERDYTFLEKALEEEYSVTVGDPSQLQIAENTDVVLIAKPGELPTQSLGALNDFLVDGGTVLAMYGAHEANLRRKGLKSTASHSSFARFLSRFGITFEDQQWLADTRNAMCTLPLIVRKGNVMQQWVQEFKYPLFPEVRSNDALSSHPALRGLGPITVPWASPIRFTPVPSLSLRSETLFETSKQSGFLPQNILTPDYDQFPESGFPPITVTDPFPLLSVFQGRFHPNAQKEGTLLLIPSSDFGSDFILKLAREVQGESHGGNVQLILNLIDWSTESTQLMSLRRAGLFQRKLNPSTPQQQQRIEMINYCAGLSFISLLFLLPRLRRRTRYPVVREEA